MAASPDATKGGHVETLSAAGQPSSCLQRTDLVENGSETVAFPQTTPALLPWPVPVVSLDAATALNALNEPVADVRSGASITYLADLAALRGGWPSAPRSCLVRDGQGIDMHGPWRSGIR